MPIAFATNQRHEDQATLRGTGDGFCRAHVPIRPDGSIESGDATRQTEVTLHDLKATLAAAGASLADVTLVQIYLTSLDYKPAVDAVYQQFFQEPYPVRACIAVSALPTLGTVIELIATTALPN